MLACVLNEDTAIMISEHRDYKKILKTLIELSYTYSRNLSENVNGEIMRILLIIAKYVPTSYEPIMKAIGKVYYNSKYMSFPNPFFSIFVGLQF